MKNFIALLFIFQTLSFSHAQEDAKNKRDHGYKIGNIDNSYGILRTVKSKALKRDMPILVFLPKNYSERKEKFPTVYMLHGVNDQPISEVGLRGLHNKNTKLLEIADMFQVVIIAPIIGNNFYLNSPIDTNAKYATYVGEEIPNFIDKEYNVMANREARILAGFSMGGYGAVSLLCRYPETFSVAINRAGVMNLATGVEDLNWDDAAMSESLLGSYWKNKENYHLNSCFNLVNKIRDRKDVAIISEVGREDFLYKTNFKFNALLNEHGIPHIYAEYPGGHEWNDYCLMSMFGHLQAFRKTIK